MGYVITELIRPLRAGLYFIVRLNLVVGVLGSLCAFAWNPAASVDDIVVVVTLPVIVMFIGFRLFAAVNRPGAAPTNLNAADVLAAAPWENPTGVRRAWFYVMGYSITMIALSIASLLALPLYLFVKISWAPAFTLFMAALLFFVGVSTFMVSLCRIYPPLGILIALVVKLAAWRLLPSRAKPRPSEHVAA